MWMRSLTFASLVVFGTACSETITEPNFPPAADVKAVNGIAYQAGASFDTDAPGEKLLVAVTATNASDQQVDIEFDGCPIRLLAYRNADRSGKPTWDSAQQEGVCPAILGFAMLSPGESQEFQATYLVREILARSLPNGRYHFTVVLSLNIETVSLKAGDLELTR